MDGPRRSYAVVLRILPGAEPWVRVEVGARWFKLPIFVPLEELLHGVDARWNGLAKRKPLKEEATVRIPLSKWTELEADSAAYRAIRMV